MTYPYINIHTHKQRAGEMSIFSYSLGEGFPTPPSPYSAGIHPWSVSKVALDEVLQQLHAANVVAIGEIGLDFSVDNFDRELQISVFKAQLEIAVERVLPVIIHCVRATELMLQILKNYKLKNVIFHSFIGSREQAKEIVKLDYYISLSGNSLQSRKTIESLAVIPVDKLFLETDATQITIEEIYALAAVKMNVTVEFLKEKLYSNYKTIFE